MAKTFTPSAHQQNFFNWVETGTGNCVLVAVAGSGKSTTIREALRYVRPTASVLILAFNSTIAKEMAAGVDRACAELGRPANNTKAATFHSIGFSAIRYRLKGVNVNLTSKKCRDLYREMVAEDVYEEYASFVCRLVGLAKGEGIGALVPDTLDRWYDLVAHHDLQLETETASEEVGVMWARKLLQRSNEAAKSGHIDFDDQLYIPLLWRLRLWQNDWVFIDEAQDTNPVRRALAKLALKPGGRLVAVGDPRQAIYGFTGASHDAIDLIKSEFHAKEMPLTVSYRCPKQVAALAQGIVPYFSAHDNAKDGTVATVDVLDGINSLPTGAAVLCRNTKPLVDLAYHLIGSGRGAVIIGRDIGEGLINLVKNMRAQTIDRLVVKLDAYRDREVAKFTAKGEEHKAEAVEDRVACVMTVVDNLDENHRTIGALIAKIESLFNDNSGQGVVTLCTIHKAKGKEWNVVAILRPDLMPSKWARQEWQALQEENLRYVAYTRAMDTLLLLDGDLADAKKRAKAA